MSLFKARDWWSTTCGVDEEFDKGCLCVANIDNSVDGSMKIIVGSHNGFLRIYKPQPTKLEDGSYSGFRADELLLEAHLNAPILHVAAGILVSSSKATHLAILHPFRLSVYTVTAVPGTVDHGTYYNLSLNYEHILQRHAFSMVVGPFGGVQGRDLVCVQSLDCTLNFYEQETFAFSRFLPDALLPGPIAYVKKTDSITTINGYAVENYRFQGLAAAKDESNEEEMNKNFTGKKVSVDWSFNAGEGGTELHSLNEKSSCPSLLIMLGHRTLYALSASGAVKFAKRFRFTPSCMLAHNEGADNSPIILVATTKQTLLVYCEDLLKWAAQLPFRPVCMERATFMDVKGLIVLLSAEGNLACCYLGTEPSVFVAPVVEPKPINFEEAEKEMQELKRIIKASNQSLLGPHNLGNELSVNITMPQHANTSDSKESTPSVTAKINLKCSSVVHDIRLMLHVEPPFRVAQNVYTFGSITESTQVVATILPELTCLPSSLKFRVHAVYTSSQGTPRVSETSSILPLNLIARACPPSKNAQCKLTVEINKEVIPSSDLFSDLHPDGSSVVGGAMGIEYYGGQQVTVVPSKSSSRYRLQSEHFSALWIVFAELVRRLKHRYRKDESGKLVFAHPSSLPVHEYFGVIEDHFANRLQMKEMELLLGQRSEQFRVVQKRLLTKMKDKTPTPLNNLDTLLEATHRHILSLTDSLSKQAIALENSCCALSAATQLMLLLLRLTVNLKEDEHSFIAACFCPDVDFDSVQGWEEKVNVSLTHLLRFCLGKGADDLGLSSCILDMPKDISRLKKHIAYLFDQLAKNPSINIFGADPFNRRENEGEPQIDDELAIPVGAKFADSSEDKPAATSAPEPDVMDFTASPQKDSMTAHDSDYEADDDNRAEDANLSDFAEDDGNEEMII